MEKHSIRPGGNDSAYSLIITQGVGHERLFHHAASSPRRKHDLMATDRNAAIACVDFGQCQRTSKS